MMKQVNYPNPGGNEEKQIFYALFGGEKEAETNFPKLTELFRKQEKKTDTSMVRCGVRQEKDIASVIVNGKKMFAYISRTQVSRKIMAQVTVHGIRTDGSPYMKEIHFDGTGRYIKSPEWSVEERVTYKTADIRYMAIEDTSLRMNTGFVSVPIQTDDFIQEHELIDPIKKGGYGQTIRVIYNRRGGGADYYYEQKRDPEEPFQIKLPINVSFKVDKSIGALKIEDSKAELLSINKEYNNTNGVSLQKVEGDKENTYHLSFQDEWKNTISDTDMHGEEEIRLHVEVKLKNDAGKEVRLEIFSTVHPNDPGYGRCFETLPIYFLWGCIEKNALIRLKDKGMVKALEVKAGDYIYTVNGAYGKVTNVYRGQEEMMRYIKTENMEAGIYVTRDHPMLTESGWKRAIDLRMGDSIQTEQGFLVITEIYTDPYQDEVVNFELEDVEGFFANGYYVGDIFTESGLRKKKEEAEALPPELEKEFQKFLEL